MRASIFATDDHPPEVAGRVSAVACHSAILGCEASAEPLQQADQPPSVFDAGNAQLICAGALVGDLTAISGLSPTDILSELFRIPVNLLPLLETPEGWTLLASFLSGATYRPTVH